MGGADGRHGRAVGTATPIFCIFHLFSYYYLYKILFASLWEVRARKGLIVPAAGGASRPPRVDPKKEIKDSRALDTRGA